MNKIHHKLPGYEVVEIVSYDEADKVTIHWRRNGGNMNTVHIPNDVWRAMVQGDLSADDRTATPWMKHVEARLEALEDTLKEKLCDWDG